MVGFHRGIEDPVGDARVVTPSERDVQGQIEDYNSLLLFPEREGVLPSGGCRVDASEPDTCCRLFRDALYNERATFALTASYCRSIAFRDKQLPEVKQLQGELHFDRPMIVLNVRKDLFDESDRRLPRLENDTRIIFRRGHSVSDTASWTQRLGHNVSGTTSRAL